MLRDALQVLSGTVLGIVGLAALSCAALAVWWFTPELRVDVANRPRSPTWN
jgi:hypothetical protein